VDTTYWRRRWDEAEILKEKSSLVYLIKIGSLEKLAHINQLEEEFKKGSLSQLNPTMKKYWNKK
jgi:hypothetical protein